MVRIPTLIVIDEHGWSFDFVSRGIIKHSTKFDCRAKRWNELTPYDQRNHVLLALNASVWEAMGHRRRWLNAPQTKFFVGVPRDVIDPRLHVCLKPAQSPFKKQINGVACNNMVAFNKLKKKYPQSQKIFYTPNGVDPTIFKPEMLVDRFTVGVTDRFNIGWSGSVEWALKRVHIAKKLKDPVTIKCNRFGKYFQKGISQKPMIDFYNSIDTFIHTSTSEGMPNVILEAAASGLPIISTPVGDIPRLVSKEWLVPVNPERLVIKELNKKLDRLKKDVELRRKVGAHNRAEIMENWTWKKQVQNYEKMFLQS